MAEANDSVGMLYQNLIDAGCDPDTLQACLSLLEKGDSAAMLPLLATHRAALLDTVHGGQKQIDCLDYLIYQISENRI